MAWYHPPMPDSASKADYHAYVRHWQRVGPLLERIRLDELRRMTPAQARQITENVLELADLAPPPRIDTTGLAKFLRIYRKPRR